MSRVVVPQQVPQTQNLVTRLLDRYPPSEVIDYLNRNPAYVPLAGSNYWEDRALRTMSISPSVFRNTPLTPPERYLQLASGRRLCDKGSERYVPVEFCLNWSLRMPMEGRRRWDLIRYFLTKQPDPFYLGNLAVLHNFQPIRDMMVSSYPRITLYFAAVKGDGERVRATLEQVPQYHSIAVVGAARGGQLPLLKTLLFDRIEQPLEVDLIDNPYEMAQRQTFGTSELHMALAEALVVDRAGPRRPQLRPELLGQEQPNISRQLVEMMFQASSGDIKRITDYYLQGNFPNTLTIASQASDRELMGFLMLRDYRDNDLLQWVAYGQARVNSPLLQETLETSWQLADELAMSGSQGNWDQSSGDPASGLDPRPTLDQTNTNWLALVANQRKRGANLSNFAYGAGRRGIWPFGINPYYHPIINYGAGFSNLNWDDNPLLLPYALLGGLDAGQHLTVTYNPTQLEILRRRGRLSAPSGPIVSSVTFQLADVILLNEAPEAGPEVRNEVLSRIEQTAANTINNMIITRSLYQAVRGASEAGLPAPVDFAHTHPLRAAVFVDNPRLMARFINYDFTPVIVQAAAQYGHIDLLTNLNIPLMSQDIESIAQRHRQLNTLGWLHGWSDQPTSQQVTEAINDQRIHRMFGQVPFSPTPFIRPVIEDVEDVF